MGSQTSTNQLLVHVVRGGENLTAISRHYHVSVQAIASVNSDIVDTDLVFEGQRIKIYCSGVFDTQTAQTTGYILHLVPIVAVCVRYIISMFQRAYSTHLKRQGLNQTNRHNFGSRSIRWKTALRDIRNQKLRIRR